MGLDNIPKQYACKKRGTAIMAPRMNGDGEQLIDPETGEPMMAIDCQETQKAGGCPWLTELNKQDELIKAGRVYGMFGTDCWYRGKYGNYLLEETTNGDTMGDGFSFYGDNEDGTEKSPQDCRDLADFIDNICDTADEQDMELYQHLRYAEWYLRWAADECDGLVCWY